MESEIIIYGYINSKAAASVCVYFIINTTPTIWYTPSRNRKLTYLFIPQTSRYESMKHTRDLNISESLQHTPLLFCVSLLYHTWWEMAGNCSSSITSSLKQFISGTSLNEGNWRIAIMLQNMHQTS